MGGGGAVILRHQIAHLWRDPVALDAPHRDLPRLVHAVPTVDPLLPRPSAHGDAHLDGGGVIGHDVSLHDIVHHLVLHVGVHGQLDVGRGGARLQDLHRSDRFSGEDVVRRVDLCRQCRRALRRNGRNVLALRNYVHARLVLLLAELFPCHRARLVHFRPGKGVEGPDGDEFLRRRLRRLAHAVRSAPAQVANSQRLAPGLGGQSGRGGGQQGSDLVVRGPPRRLRVEPGAGHRTDLHRERRLAGVLGTLHAKVLRHLLAR
mmetsp:Transcript_37884/g.108930  ORF Transcript_37884/g.108930 Transcript_37884/m.108930 type:complete len:261 (-) Transcript_37884:30-812(-)